MIRDIRAVILFTDALGKHSERDIICEAMDRQERWVWEGPRPERASRYRFDRIACATLTDGRVMDGPAFGRWLAGRLPVYDANIEDFALLVGQLTPDHPNIRRQVIMQYCCAVEASAMQMELAQVWAETYVPGENVEAMEERVEGSFHRDMAERLLSQIRVRD